MMLVSLISTALVAGAATALNLNINDKSSIEHAQALVAQGMMDYYNGNDTGQTPGMFQPPYYWWEAAVAWNALLDYTYYTQNDTYAPLIKSSMLFQTGPYWNYLPPNQSSSEGNDDQGFWGILAMSAAEDNFSAPGPGNPSWAYLAQAVFNSVSARWNTETCGGGLRWQIYTWNHGYNYKNTIAAACLFNIGARLFRYTGGTHGGNQTFLYWCEKIWNWTTGVQFVNYTAESDGYPAHYSIYDGAYIQQNCTQIHPYQWTYNYGLFMAGTAFLYNATEDQKWLDRLQLIWNQASHIFFKNDVMFEPACGPTCNTDEQCFKGIFSRMLGLTMLMAPTFYDVLLPYIQASAEAAARSCSGGYDGHTCGEQWIDGGAYDNKIGLGEQICALDIFNVLLIKDMPPPMTLTTGATSQPNAHAGTNSTTSQNEVTAPLTITTKDKAGAGVITALVVLLVSGASFWMLK